MSIAKIGVLVLAGVHSLCFAVPVVAPRQEESFPPRMQEPGPRKSAARQAGRIESGKPVERAIAGGQTDIFQIDVKAGEFLRVVAEQRGIDVVLTLLGPEGETIVEADRVNGAWGPESASMIAKASGTFQVQVESRDSSALAGHYHLKVTDLRKPTSRDEKRIAAERAIFQAGRLGTQTGTDAKREAIGFYGDALLLWRELGDHYAEALTVFSVGEVYEDLGNKQKALDYYGQALPLERAVGDRAGEAATLGKTGDICHDLGKEEKALDYYGQALPLERAVGNRAGEAETLDKMGSVDVDLGRTREALDNYIQALTLVRAYKVPLMEGVVLSNLMIYWKIAKNPVLAIFFGKQAVNTYRQIRRNILSLDPQSQSNSAEKNAVTYRRLADMLIAEGRLQEAEQVLDLGKEEAEYFGHAGRRSRGSSDLAAVLSLDPDELRLRNEYQQVADQVTVAGEEWTELSSEAEEKQTEGEKQGLAKASKKLELANLAFKDFFDHL